MASKSRWWRWGVFALLTLVTARMMRRRAAEPVADENGVDQTLDDSFPASDPPGWTSTTAGAPAARSLRGGVEAGVKAGAAD